MKVLLLNGSPHEKGCTYTALNEIAKTLVVDDVEAEIFWLGTDAVKSCTACGACRKLGKCIHEDIANTIIAKLDDIDALVIGSPVHYAGASGQVTAVMDRVFYAATAKLRYKPGAAIVSARRGGTTAAFDQLNKYFTISGMPVASSVYWNGVHGRRVGEATEDAEGLQTMRALAENMTFLMRSIELGKEKYGLPEKEKRVFTNFIR